MQKVKKILRFADKMMWGGLCILLALFLLGNRQKTTIHFIPMWETASVTMPLWVALLAGFCLGAFMAWLTLKMKNASRMLKSRKAKRGDDKKKRDDDKKKTQLSV